MPPERGGSTRTTLVLALTLAAVVAVPGASVAGSGSTPGPSASAAALAITDETPPAAGATATGGTPSGEADVPSVAVTSVTAAGSVPNYTHRTNLSDDDTVPTTVPRNGTVLRLDLVTGVSETGERQNATVTVEIPDSDAAGDPQNVTGEFLNATAGGANDSVVSIDNGSDRITVTTGDDGETAVFYRTDRSSVDLENDACPDVSAPDDACVRAFLTRDPSVYDNSTVDFVGVVEPAPASLSGLVTNDREQPVAGAVVWVDRVDFVGDYVLTATPDDPGDPDSFVLRVYDGSVAEGNLLENATVRADRLRQGGSGYGFEALDRISADESYALWTRSRGLPTTGAYTLSRVPASNSTVTATTYDVRGALRVAGGDLLAGRASSVRTAANATGTGNVVLGGATRTFLTVTALSAPENATAGESIRVSATVRNDGGITGSGTVVWRIDADDDGDYGDAGDATATLGSVTLDPGTTATVSADVTVPETVSGTLAHGAFTDDSNRTTAITVAPAADCPGLLSHVEVYAGGDCRVDTPDLVDAIGDWARGDVPTAGLVDVINAWAQAG